MVDVCLCMRLCVGVCVRACGCVCIGMFVDVCLYVCIDTEDKASPHTHKKLTWKIVRWWLLRDRDTHL